MIYLNTLATTFKEMSAVNVKEITDDLRERIASLIYLGRDSDENSQAIGGGNVILSSGASESNAFIIRVVSELNYAKGKPHIITTWTEHQSLYNACKYLESIGLVSVSYIKPDRNGKITPASVLKEIRNSTCLISILHANNETGQYQEVNELADVVYGINPEIIFHSDAVASFPVLGSVDLRVDAVTGTMHKFYGPVNVGFLAVSDRLLAVFKKNHAALVFGNQIDGMRGGTIDPFICKKAIETLSWFKTRNFDQSFSKLLDLKKFFYSELSKFAKIEFWGNSFSSEHLEKYLKQVPLNEILCISFSAFDGNGIQNNPNTISISFVCNDSVCCNMQLRSFLQSRNIVVGTGAACSENKPSRVLLSRDVPSVLARGVLRISFSDTITFDEIKLCVDTLHQGILIISNQ